MCSWLYVFTEATLLREYIEWKNYERKTTYFDPNEPTIEMRLVLEKCGDGDGNYPAAGGMSIFICDHLL